MFKRIKKQKEMVSTYKRVFTSDDGRRILSDLMNVCGMQRSSFDSDPLKMAYHEGERAVVLRILKSVNVSAFQLNNWFKMIEKQQDELSEEQV